MPNQDLETSVYRIKSLNSQQINKIGEENVAKPLGKSLLGWADIVVLSILEQNLKVEPEPTPHRLHANIVGWSPDKSKRKMIAIELAAEAHLHLLNNL